MSLMTFGNIYPTKVMAIEQEGVYYETDETTEYVNDMADYVEDKYQPYANDNNYVKSQNSDFVKKIKCNNINSNLNGLNVNTLPGSTTAEDIGAQALQDNDDSANTFENGYGRNNGNFDFDCINNNDNQGGRGQLGPEGPEGPQGPAGINVINGSNSYAVIGERATIPLGGEFVTGEAECDDGDSIINAGYSIGGPPFNTTGSYDVRFFGPVGLLPPAETWNTFIVGSSGTTVTTTIVCFDNPPAHIP